MNKAAYKKYSREDQRSLATWAADCAERVLPFFEKSYPNDNRPRKAIEVCRTWVRTGVFRMADIRGASLPLMLLHVTLKKMTPLVLPHVPQVRRWQLHMSPNMPTVVLIML